MDILSAKLIWQCRLKVKLTFFAQRLTLEWTGKYCCTGHFLVYSGAYVLSFLPLFVCVIHLWYCFTGGSEENNPRVRPSSGSESQTGMKTETEGDGKQISRFPVRFITLLRLTLSLVVQVTSNIQQQ